MSGKMHSSHAEDRSHQCLLLPHANVLCLPHCCLGPSGVFGLLGSWLEGGALRRRKLELCTPCMLTSVLRGVNRCCCMLKERLYAHSSPTPSPPCAPLSRGSSGLLQGVSEGHILAGFLWNLAALTTTPSVRIRPLSSRSSYLADCHSAPGISVLRAAQCRPRCPCCGSDSELKNPMSLKTM